MINTAANIGYLEQLEEELRFLGIKLINFSDFTELLVRLAFNSIVVLLIIHFMYSKYSRKKDFYFSYIAIGLVVFLLCFLLNSVKLELGFALGLFAIFGIIRYRTDAIPIKEMTYLFVVIGVSVINALANKKVSYAELLLTNSVILGILWILEKRLLLKQEHCFNLIYENIENVKLFSDEELIADLKERTGRDIKRFEIKKMDYMRDVVDLTLYYNVNGRENHEEKKNQ
jgi:hypothetical protein